ncbi:hypothetical protein ACJMK2_041907 [Sinanodonta woodiana]|uniref:F-box domain-containing protein n=1 Tax=Sinanodonta woodiana TaxID=1069815 RepID=A0ABD3W8W2_SINWO
MQDAEYVTENIAIHFNCKEVRRYPTMSENLQGVEKVYDSKSVDGCYLNTENETMNIDNIYTEDEEHFHSADVNEVSTAENYANLATLPVELLILISTYLDSKTIIKSLSKVCRAFYELFSADIYWKTRISQRWPKKYPPVAVEDFKWHQGCMEREEFCRVWSDPETQTHSFMLKEGFFAAVDVVHVMKDGKLLASGSRDRYLNLFDLDKFDPEKPDCLKDVKVHTDSKAHKGWVWSMASVDNILATGSWDTYLRLFDVDANCQEMSRFKCKSALLGLYMEPNFIAAAGYDKKLYLVDPRAPEAEMTIKRYHKQPILCIAADKNYVITGSEDKTICVFDRRTGSLQKRLEVDSFVMDLSFGYGQLWFGDKEGKIHLLDASKGLFDKIETYDVGHTEKVTGIQHTLGGIFTCSTDGNIKILEPSLDPGVVRTLSVHSGPLCDICYKDNVLASAGSDIAIGVWIKR